MATEATPVINGRDVTEDLKRLELELHRKVTDEISVVKSELFTFAIRFNPKLNYDNYRGMVSRPFNEKALEILAKVYKVAYINNEEIEGTWYVYFGPSV